MERLNIEEIYNGIRKCFANATDLIADADYLFNDNRFARAYSLYQLGTEETAKIKLLIHLAAEKLSNNEINKKDAEHYNNLFKNHIGKIRYAIASDVNYYNFADKIGLPQLRDPQQIKNELENLKQMDIYKQDGFYVSLSHKKFREPSAIITKEKCSELSILVKHRLSTTKGTMDLFFDNNEFFIRRWNELK